MSVGMRAGLKDRSNDRSAKLGVIALGYVGLPLAVEMARSEYRTLGFDVAQAAVDGVQWGTVSSAAAPPFNTKAWPLRYFGTEPASPEFGRGLLTPMNMARPQA